MELRHLIYFCKVAELKSFTQAAKQLFVSQPSVTNAIHQLETELGIKLFHRNTKKVSLTFEGNFFYKRASNILASIQYSVKEIKELDRDRPIKLGLPHMIMDSQQSSIYLQLLRNFPDLKLEIEEDGSQSIYQKLQSGSLDIGFIVMPEQCDTLATIPLKTEEIVVCCSPQHPHGKLNSIELSQLANETFASLSSEYCHKTMLLNYCKMNKFTPNIALTSNRIDTIKSVVSNNLAVTLLMKSVVKKEDPIHTISASPPIYVSVGLAWKKDRMFTTELDPLVNFLKGIFFDYSIFNKSLAN